MSLPISLPVTARPTITSNIFTATWNNPTINRYDFTNVAGNQNQNVIQTTSASVYIIERTNFSGTIPEGVYQESIDSAIDIPVMVFKTLKTQQLIFPRKQPYINYVDNLELLLFVPSDQSNDEITVSFEGILFQVAATVGLVTIKTFLQLNIYEVQNTDWTSRFISQNYGAEGDLALRGKASLFPLKINEGTFG